MTASTFWRAAVASLSLLVALDLAADQPYVVRDIHPGAGPGLGSTPRLVPFADDRALLFASEEDHGFELWITDGTAAETRLLRDICPGPCSSDARFQGALGERILFSARSAAGAPAHLWITDGTWAGTRALGGGAVGNTAAVGLLESQGLFFFAAEHNGENGLWSTDGTPAGTRPVALDGPDGWPRSPGPGAAAGGRLVFGAHRGNGDEVTWVTDGTSTGTRRLAAIPPDRHPSRVIEVRRLGARAAVFARTGGGFGCRVEIWSTGGTPAATERILVFEELFCQVPTRFLQVAEAEGALWFAGRPEGIGQSQLWRTDGTAAGTRPVTSFTGDAFADQPFAHDAATVLFAADDGVHGREPWIADAAGARLLADLCPGPCDSSPSSGSNAGALFFAADGGPLLGVELWRREGDDAVLVEDVCPGSCSSSPVPLGAAGGTAFFIAGLPGDPSGRELWATPLGGNGAEPVTDFASGDPFPRTTLFSYSAATVGERLVFTADDGVHGPEVWRSDGTLGGTVLVADIETRNDVASGSHPSLLTPWGDRLLFFAFESEVDDWQPWISDGTEPGTRRLGVVVDPDDLVLRYSEPVILGSDALFTAADGYGAPLELWRARASGPPVRLIETIPGTAVTSARLDDRAIFLVPGFHPPFRGEVWASDGTAAGTRRLAELMLPRFGTGVIDGDDTGELGGRLFFAATDNVEGGDGFGLWATDGTSGGTVQVSPVFANREAMPPDAFAGLGDRLLFAADGEGTGRELWRTDGTADGTEMLVDLLPGDLGSSPFGLTTVGDRVFFFAADEGGFALWTTDGTAAGTVRVSSAPGYVEVDRGLPQRAVAGGRLYFAGAGHRSDLWVSDGTPAGTGSLAPLLPANADVTAVWSGGDRVWVSMFVPGPFDTTAELWQTDGTLEGTRRLVSLPSAQVWAPISELARVGSLLYFRGLHPEVGYELMALPLDPPDPCSADTETLCLGDGRFAVRARWRDPRTGDSGNAGALPLPGSDRTGLFWFFAPDNVELVVKNLAAGPVNGYFWNFYGALSDVEYTIEVSDTATGRQVEYFNPGGEICGRGDTTAFPARPPVPLPVPAPAAAPVRSLAAGGENGTACGGSAGDLCLLGGRFRVEVEWADQRSGDTGAGTAIPYADRSGFFWFFDDENIELVVKMIDGRQVNGRFWFFYGALSDVEYTITVTDVETDQQASYHNPPGEICGRGDTAAF